MFHEKTVLTIVDPDSYKDCPEYTPNFVTDIEAETNRRKQLELEYLLDKGIKNNYHGTTAINRNQFTQSVILDMNPEIVVDIGIGGKTQIAQNRMSPTYVDLYNAGKQNNFIVNGIELDNIFLQGHDEDIQTTVELCDIRYPTERARELISEADIIRSANTVFPNVYSLNFNSQAIPNPELASFFGMMQILMKNGSYLLLSHNWQTIPMYHNKDEEGFLYKKEDDLKLVELLFSMSNPFSIFDPLFIGGHVDYTIIRNDFFKEQVINVPLIALGIPFDQIQNQPDYLRTIVDAMTQHGYNAVLRGQMIGLPIEDVHSIIKKSIEN